MSGDVGNDLSYVRDVVRRSESRAMPGSILFLWAGIAVVGFATIDLAPRLAAGYWLVASLAGFALSSWLGTRHGRSGGQLSREEGRRHMLHWGGMLAAILLVPVLTETGHLDDKGAGLAIVLIIALGYWLAGVHFLASLKWIGGIAAATYVALALVGGFPYPWTIAGLVLASGLIVAGRSARATRVEA